MPHERSQLSRYVIPDDTSPDGVCCVTVPVPDDPQYRALFLGAIWRLSLQTHYERDAAHSGQIVAAVWRDVYEQVRDSMGQCSQAETFISVTVTTNFRMQLMIEFTANGLDGIAPDRPDTFWDEDSGDVGDEIVQRENALCNACMDYVNTIADDLAKKILAAGITGIPAITPVAMAIAPVAGAIFIGALSILTELTIDAVNDPEIRRMVACCMYDNLKGIVISEANFNASMTGCGFPALSDEEIVRDMLEAGVNDRANYLAFVNVLGSHFGLVGVEIIDCNCGICDAYAESFNTGLEDMTFLPGDPAIPVEPHAWGEEGEWDANVGETAGGIQGAATGLGCATWGCLHCVVYVKVPADCTIIEVNWRVKYQNGGANRSHRLEFFDGVGDLVHEEFNELFGASGAWQSDGADSMSETGVTWIRIFNGSDLGKDNAVDIDSVNVIFG